MNPEEDPRGGRRSRGWYPGENGGGDPGWGKIGDRSPNKQYIYEDQYISQTRTRVGDDEMTVVVGRVGAVVSKQLAGGMAWQRVKGILESTGKLENCTGSLNRLWVGQIANCIQFV